MTDKTDQEQICPYDGDDCVIGFGLCHCGCEETTNLSRQARVIDGMLIPAGQPNKFIRYHARRLDGKISDQQAAEMRRRYLNGGMTQNQLALEYNISQAAVSYILRLKSHKQAGIAKRQIV